MTANDHRIERTLTQRDFDLFAALSGDDNPIHVDPEFCKSTRFGRTLSHGMLLYTVLWGLIQRHYPGARQLSQNLMFPAGTHAGEALHVEITAGDVVEGARRSLATRISRVVDGIVVCEGATEILLPAGGSR